MGSMIRVILADDHPLFREGVRHSLASAAGVQLVGEASDGNEGVRLVRELQPDVALLDIGMPAGGGITAAAEIAALGLATRVVMLTVSEDEDDLLAAFRAGARGYALKGISARELLDVVRRVAAGEVFVSPALAAGILLALSRGRAPDPLAELTERERQVLALVAQGLTNREVGRRLHLAEKTVKHYMTIILEKLHVRSRLEAALIASREGRLPRAGAG